MVELTSSAVLVETVHFGPLAVAPEQVFHFTAPLLPFIGVDRYALLTRDEVAPFAWLQALNEPGLALVVAPYAEVAGRAAPPISAAVARELGADARDAELLVLAVVTLGATPGETTVNLLAPLYVCPATRRARQVVTEGDLALARAPLLTVGAAI